MEVPLYFKSNILQELRHGFFGCRGGVSSGHVWSLNCYPYTYVDNIKKSIDDMTHVQTNRQKILETLGIHAIDILTARQVHGNKIVMINSHEIMDFTEADGLITCVPNLPLGILTADCVPVLYTDDEHQCIGAAHVGWKGAFLNIHLNMIEAFQRIGIPTHRIKATIGPSIQVHSYEVDEAFYHNFLQQHPDRQHYFLSSEKPGRYQFDLPKIVYDDLIRRGLKKVDWIRLDTFIHKDLFFSHRRATLEGLTVTGRQISLISL